MDKINVKIIGLIHTNYSDDEVRLSVGGVEGYIEIFKEYQDGLDGIEEFSHLIIIAWLHKVKSQQREVLKIRPRKWVRLGIDISDIPEIGVFCTDSPHRPNPIALTIVELIKREGNILVVNGLDLFDKTPVLDIKPYTASRRIEFIKLPKWYHRLSKRIKNRFNKEVEP